MLKDLETGQTYVPNEVHIADLKPKFRRTEYPEKQYIIPEDEKMRRDEGVEGAEGAEAEVAALRTQDDDELSEPMQQENVRPVRPKRKAKAPQYYGYADDTEDHFEDEGVGSDEDDQEYRVKKILARRKGPDNKWEYLVQFTGYPPNEAMWLKEAALNKKALKEVNKVPITRPRKK